MQPWRYICTRLLQKSRIWWLLFQSVKTLNLRCRMGTLCTTAAVVLSGYKAWNYQVLLYEALLLYGSCPFSSLTAPDVPNCCNGMSSRRWTVNLVPSREIRRIVNKPDLSLNFHYKTLPEWLLTTSWSCLNYFVKSFKINKSSVLTLQSKFVPGY